MVQHHSMPKPKNVHTFLTALMMTLGSLNPESLQQRATVTVGGILRSSLTLLPLIEANILGFPLPSLNLGSLL